MGDDDDEDRGNIPPSGMMQAFMQMLAMICANPSIDEICHLNKRRNSSPSKHSRILITLQHLYKVFFGRIEHSIKCTYTSIWIAAIIIFTEK